MSNEYIKQLLNMHSSDRQFGFKKSVGCSHAIYTLRKVFNYYTANSSTVNICSLDLTKALDCINLHALFAKPMDRGLPKCFVILLYTWCSKLFSTVRWGDAHSKLFKLTAGVRQGGILSPALFSVFVNDVLLKLEKVKKGYF